MNLSDIFRFLRELLQTNAEVIAAFLTGCIFAAMVIYFFRWWLAKTQESPELTPDVAFAATMACINALTASDYLLVPTLFDKTSRDAVGRLLSLIKHLRTQRVCAELQVLGIVGNKSFRQKTLTTREKTAWLQLKTDVKRLWNGEPLTLFRRHLPAAKAFAEASEPGELADRRLDLYPWFADLAAELDKEIHKRVASHASS